MKLVVFCLFAVCCYALANTSSNDRLTQRKKFQEIIKQMDKVQASLQLNGQMLRTPPNNITECCCLSALRCFRANLNVQFNIEINHSKFYKSLKHHITEEGLNYCDSGNKSTCQDCDTHPKENATEFFYRLKTLFQRAITKLTD